MSACVPDVAHAIEVLLSRVSIVNSFNV